MATEILKKERAPSDVELSAMARIVRTLESLEPAARARVVHYMLRRYAPPLTLAEGANYQPEANGG